MSGSMLRQFLSSLRMEGASPVSTRFRLTSSTLATCPIRWRRSCLAIQTCQRLCWGHWPVSKNFRGRSIGELLLLDAFKRVLANTRDVASAVIAVDAKDERACEFYLRHDFVPLPSQPNRLFYSVKTIEKLFGAKRGSASY